MNRTTDISYGWFRALSVLIWAAVAGNTLLYASHWDQLPKIMATHFNFANQPNGWMSREGSFAFAICFASLLAVITTVILFRVKRPDAVAWGLLALFYVVQATLLWAENATITYNLRRAPVNAAPVFAVGIGATVLLLLLALASRRGPELAATNILAQETHSSPGFAALMAAPTLVFAIIIARSPLSAIKFALVFAILLMLAAAAMAWAGFRYVFTPAGVEVRTLGFRLRSIPAREIQGYSVEKWNLLRGYGIRGVGDQRAYVWGNSGVRIKTAGGEVFLGHSRPEKVMHDLDKVTGGAADNRF